MVVRIVETRVSNLGDRQHLVALIVEELVNISLTKWWTADLLTDQKGGDSFQ